MSDKVKAGTQMEVPGIPAQDVTAKRNAIEARVNEAVARVLDAEKALREARAEERSARAELGRFLRA